MDARPPRPVFERMCFMICPFCNKYEATIHLTQITQGKKQEVHICEFCAKEKGLLTSQLVDFSELLVGMASSLGGGAEVEGQLQAGAVEAPVLENPDAAKALALFQKTGRFSSPRDYELLEPQLSSLLEKIHGAGKHGGHPDALRLRLNGKGLGDPHDRMLACRIG